MIKFKVFRKRGYSSWYIAKKEGPFKRLKTEGFSFDNVHSALLFVYNSIDNISNYTIEIINEE